MGNCVNCMCKAPTEGCNDKVKEKCGEPPVTPNNKSQCFNSNHSKVGNINVTDTYGCANEIANYLKYQLCKRSVENTGDKPNITVTITVNVYLHDVSFPSSGYTSYLYDDNDNLIGIVIDLYGDITNIFNEAIDHEIAHVINDMNSTDNFPAAIGEGLAVSSESDKCGYLTDGADYLFNKNNTINITDILTNQNNSEDNYTYGVGFIVVDYLLNKGGGYDCDSRKKLNDAINNAMKGYTNPYLAPGSIESWRKALMDAYGIDLDRLEDLIMIDLRSRLDTSNPNDMFSHGCNWCTCKNAEAGKVSLLDAKSTNIANLQDFPINNNLLIILNENNLKT